LILIHEDSWGYMIRCYICEGCLESYVRMMYGKELKQCPCMGCNKPFTLTTLKNIAPPKIFQDYKQSMWISKLTVCQNFRFCPNENCGTGIELPESCCKAENISCPSCDYEFCPQCYGPSHSEVGTCREFLYLSSASHTCFETKQCPFCLVWIEKNNGCDHMTCDHCHNEFCWSCMGDYHKPFEGEHCHKRVVRPFFEDLVPNVSFTCLNSHPLKPMFAPIYYGYRQRNITCAKCSKGFRTYDSVYGCYKCEYYLCTECADDTKLRLLCTLTSDVTVRNEESLDSDINFVLKAGTIVFVKLTSEYQHEYSWRSYNYTIRRTKQLVRRAKIKFCCSTDSYGWCSLDRGHRVTCLSANRLLLHPHPKQKEALRIFKTQNFIETPLYTSPEIQEKVFLAELADAKRRLNDILKEKEEEIFIRDPKSCSDGVLNHSRKPYNNSDRALSQSRASKSFRKRNYYKTRRRGRIGIPAKLIRKTRSRKRQNCRDHKFTMNCIV